MTGAVIPEGSVVITPTEMYREVVDTNRTVQSISTKLDGALSDHDRRLVDHENRIRGVERRIWIAVGGGTAISTGAAALIAQLMTKH